MLPAGFSRSAPRADQRQVNNAMQFSIRTLLVTTAVVALLFVLPGGAISLITGTIWYIVPAILAMFVVYGQSEKQAFAIGGLCTYVAIIVSTSNAYAYLPGFLWWIGNILCAGFCSVVVWRQLRRVPARVNQGE